MRIKLILFILYILILLGIFIPWIKEKKDEEECHKEERPILWFTLFFLIFIHIFAGIGILKVHNPKALTIVYTLFLGIWFALSVTAGKHRLFTHQTYKAHPILQIFYVLGTLTVPTSSIQDWVETHKIHHRYSDTCQDPHYSNKNTFFYSHFGWIYHQRDEKEKENIKKENLDELYKNPYVSFQKKYHSVLLISVQVILFLLPLLWGDFVNCFWLSIIRIMIALNAQFSVNSLAHSIGDRPYDPRIRPTQNHFVSFITFGEGYHNYHHLYPKDYRCNDSLGGWNPTTWFLICMNRLGLAYDFKYYSREKNRWEIE